MMLSLSVALKGALILALASGAVALLRGAPAAARHGIWVAAFVALLALPLLATVGPSWEIGILPSSGAVSPPEVPTAPLAPIAPGTPIGVQTEMDAPLPPIPPAPSAAGFGPSSAPLALSPSASGNSGWFGSSPTMIALAVWGIGGVLVLLGWAVTLFAAWLFVQRATPEADPDWLDAFERARLLTGIDDHVRLLRSDALDVPVAWGLGTPAVVLPSDADAWDEDRREAVLLHELAHIRRRDARTQLLAQAAVAVHWFDPLAWWAYRRFLIEREHACDDAVLRGGARPSAYAGHLVDIARGIRRERIALAGLSPMARASCLEGRVLSILGERRRNSLTRVGSIFLACAAVVLVLPLAACQLTEATAHPDTYRASKPMGGIHVSASREHAEDMEEDLELMEEDLADIEFVLEELALDTIPDAETILGPALESALAKVRGLRSRGLNLSNGEWREIELEIEEAFQEAREDYNEAIADAMEGDEWRSDLENAMREVRNTRFDVHIDGEAIAAEVQRETEAALREAGLHSRTESQRRAAELARDAARHAEEQIRQQANRDRSREEARRAAQLDRDQARSAGRRNRDASQAQRQRTPVTPQPPVTPRTTSRVEAPRATSSSFNYTISTGESNVVVTSSSSARDWAGALEGWKQGIRNLDRAVNQRNSASELAILDRSVANMSSALDGISGAANGWAKSSTERRIVREAIQDARDDLKDLRSDLADARGDRDH